MDDELLPEYDFAKMPIVERGKGRRHRTPIVQLEPDVAEAFPDAQAVNEGLRLLIRLVKRYEVPESDSDSIRVEA